MSSQQIRLSADETAMIVAHVGAEELALQMLLAQGSGPSSRDDARGRLAAAADALAGRGLVITGDDGSLRLEDSLARVAGAVAWPDFTLRVSRMVAAEETSMTFHFVEGAIVSQQRAEDLSSVFAEEESLEGVIDVAADLFGLEAGPAVAAPVSVPPSLLEDLTHAASTERDRQAVSEDAAAATVLDAFAADHAAPSWRGSFLRTSYGHGHPVTDIGALIIGGAGRVWQLGLDTKKVGNVVVVPATRASVAEEIKRLCRA